MIQPQVPLRLPCYDFSLLNELTIGYGIFPQSLANPSRVLRRAVCARPRDVFSTGC